MPTDAHPLPPTPTARVPRSHRSYLPFLGASNPNPNRNHNPERASVSPQLLAAPRGIWRLPVHHPIRPPASPRTAAPPRQPHRRAEPVAPRWRERPPRPGDDASRDAPRLHRHHCHCAPRRVPDVDATRAGALERECGHPARAASYGRCVVRRQGPRRAGSERSRRHWGWVAPGEQGQGRCGR